MKFPAQEQLPNGLEHSVGHSICREPGPVPRICRPDQIDLSRLRNRVLGCVHPVSNPAIEGLGGSALGLEAHAELRSIALSHQISIIASAIGKIAILLIGATVISFAAVTTFEFLVLFAA